MQQEQDENETWTRHTGNFNQLNVTSNQ